VIPVAQLDISPNTAQAMLISLETSLSVTAIDLLLRSMTRSVQLQLDLREDLDGKPDKISLFHQPVKLTLDRNSTQHAIWVSVPLPSEFHFLDQKKQRYWLVIQSLEGDALWSVEEAIPGRAGIQVSQDGGFSWRETRASGSGPLSGFLRLRRRTSRFETPIVLEVGKGKSKNRVQFERFQALGRVEFPLDLPEIAEALNQNLAKGTSASCPEIEHLENGNFKDWLRLGKKVNTLRKVDLSGIPSHKPRVVAIFPDGAQAYVGSSIKSETKGSEENLVFFKPGLILVDMVCGKVIEAQALDASGSINALIINTLGSRAYAISGNRELILIDTSTHRPLRRFPIAGARALALSPDDRQLYVSVAAAKDNPPSVKIFDTQKLEIQVPRTEFSSDLEIILEIGEPMSLTVSADGMRLYVAIHKGNETNGEIKAFDTVTQTQIGAAVPVGKEPRAIALTPDGNLLVVANTEDNTLNFIDTVRGKILGAAVQVGGSPQALSISPDGTRVFVAKGSEAKLGVIDLITGKHELIDIGQKSSDVAITPDGGKVLVIGLGDPDFFGISTPPRASLPALLSIQIGERQPDMWSPFGWLRPRCLDNPPQQFAELGLASKGKASIPSSLSQVVPVKASCSYNFSFLAQATQADSFAEVMWLGQNGELLRNDQHPIEKGWVSGGEKSFTPREVPRPRLHRKQLKAPKTAVQAELRFSVPAGALAVVGNVSLAGTSETVLNSDFRLQKALSPEGWTSSPEAPLGFSVIQSAKGTQLRNAGTGPVTLLQTIPAVADRPFSLIFKGCAILLSLSNQATHRSPLAGEWPLFRHSGLYNDSLHRFQSPSSRWSNSLRHAKGRDQVTYSRQNDH